MSDTPELDLPTVSRRTMLRDLGLFQIKLLVDGLRDLLLVPVSIVAGIVSIASGTRDATGPQFYQVLEWGKESEHWIDLFGASKNSAEQPKRPAVFAEQGMDDIVERLEAFVVDEYKSGGLTAQAREHLNKLLKTVRRKSPTDAT